VPLVTTFYGLDVSMLPRRRWWRNRYRELFEAGDMFLAEGSFMRDRLVELGVPQEKTRVIALGIDLERIPLRLRQPVERPVILMAASFREKKGHEYAVDAFRRIARRFPGARIEFIGDGPLRPHIVGHFPMDLLGRVRFHGVLPYDKYLEVLDQASILLAPSITAENGDTEGGAPVCLLEGQASGIPIVATEHCDIPNVLCPGLRQFLVPERDVDALAESLSSMLENQELWSDLGAQGRKWAEESFDIRTQAKKIGNVYRELIS
jgi:colanic acid/amylovoran biosynthesis glycosyltransferase